MTAFDDRIRARVQAVTQRTGQISVVLRRITRTAGPNPAQHPPTVLDLVTVGSTAAAAATIDLLAVGGRGMLVAGDSFTIAGHPAPYVIQASVTAVAGAFSDVSISPTMATLVSSGTAVTMMWSSDTTLLARVSNYPSRMIDGNLILATDNAVIVPGPQLATKPLPGDQLLVYAAGPNLPPDLKVVVNTTRAYVQDLVGLWTIQARDM